MFMFLNYILVVLFFVFDNELPTLFTNNTLPQCHIPHEMSSPTMRSDKEDKENPIV